MRTGLGRIGLVLAFLLQAGLLGWILVDRAFLIAHGREIRLAVVPVDPRDLLRGDYVVLSFPMSRIQTNQIDGDDDFAWGDPIYVSLVQDGDAWKAAAVHKAPPEGEGVYLKGSVTDVTDLGDNCGGATCAIYSVEYNLEEFFVPEGEGRALEKLRNDQHISVDVSVGSGGRAALKRLLVDGEVRYEEGMF